MPQNAQTLLERVPPYNERAELAALGCCLIESRAATVVMMLNESAFYLPRHRLIFRAIKASTVFPVDEILLCDALERTHSLDEAGGREYIGRLIMDTPTPSNVESYCRIIRECADKRALLELGGRLLQASADSGRPEAAIQQAERTLATMRTAQTGPDVGSRPTQQEFDTLENLKKAAEFADADHLKRSFPDFDGRRTLAGTFGYSDPETGHLDLIVFSLKGQWNEEDGKPKPKSGLHGYENAEGRFLLRRPPGLMPLFNRKALQAAPEVVLVEGEPNVIMMKTLGVVATCSPSGSKDAAHIDWSPLNGKKLVTVWSNKHPTLEYQNGVIAELNKLPQPPLVKIVDLDAIDSLPTDGSGVVDLVRIMGDLPDEQKAEVVCGYIATASPTGAHAELLSETEDVLSGKRNVVDWPWKTLSSITEAITAGGVTVICGSPGASKSLFLLQAILEWFRLGILCSVLELESGRAYHLRRAAAMVAECSFLTSLKWQRTHPEETRRMVKPDEFSAFGQCIHAVPKGQDANVGYLLGWLNTEVQRGQRIIAIDAVTLADFGGDLYNEDSKLIRGIKNAIEPSMSSFIAITHPRPGSHGKTLDNMALTRGWGNFTPDAMWYEFVRDAKKRRVKTISCSAGEITAEIPVNRIVHVLKSRNTGGAFTRIGFDFDNNTLKVSELGIITD